MKFNFKKIASVLTSTVMLSSTIAFAAAANFPEPFVKDGVGNYAIVVGAGASDSTAANQLDAFLKNQITDVNDDSAPITLEGESFMIADGDEMLNIGENPTNVDSSLDSDDLPTLLADGIYTNDQSDDFEYEQTIDLSPDLGVNFQADEDDTVYIGIPLEDGDNVLNYTLEFTDSGDAEGGAADSGDEYPDLSDSYLTLLGKEYYISDVESTANGLEMTLLDSANKVTLLKGEPQTVTVGDKSYDIELSYVHSTNGVKVKVDGVETPLLDEGKTRKLADGTYLTILENLAGEDADADSAVVSLGSGEIVLTNGQEVEINGEAISDIDTYNDATVKAYFTNSTTDLSSMTLAWNVGDDIDFESGDELVMPGFETVKVVMGDFVTPAEEVLSFAADDDDTMVATVEVKDGKYDLPILFAGNDSSYTAVGEKADRLLRTSSTSTLSYNDSDNKMSNDYFVMTAIDGTEGESHIVRVTSIDSDNDDRTVFEDIVSGDKKTLDVGDTAKFGDVSFRLNDAAEDPMFVNLTITSTGGNFSRLVTKEGLLMNLPSAISANGTLTSTITLTEETGDEDGEGTIGGGSSFTVTFDVDETDGVYVYDSSLTELTEKDDSDVKVAYVASELATKVAYDTEPDQETLDVTYHGGESYQQLYVAAGDATSSGGGSSSGALVVTDAEVSDVSSKNLIVVGGTCVNKVAAKLLNVEAQYPVCGDAWEAATGVGAGEFLIQTFNSPYTTGKVAMLVAGYNQADTTSAEAALESDAVIETADGIKYTQSPGTTLTKV